MPGNVSSQAEGTIIVRGKEAGDLFTQHRLSPEENPVWIGSLFVTGRHKGSRICAPLVLSPLAIERIGADEFELSLQEDDLAAQFRTARSYRRRNRGGRRGGIPVRGSQVAEALPEVPLTLQAANDLVRTMLAFLDVPLAAEPFPEFDEADLSEDGEGETLRLTASNACFLGKEPSAFTVIRELEALAEETDIVATALDATIIPSLPVPTEVFESSAGWPEPPEGPDAEFDHPFEVIPLTENQREIVLSARGLAAYAGNRSARDWQELHDMCGNPRSAPRRAKRAHDLSHGKGGRGRRRHVGKSGWAFCGRPERRQTIPARTG